MKIAILDDYQQIALKSADWKSLPAGTETKSFAGHIADPRTIYAAADVLLLTSRYEGTPLTVLEAMASGVPVVAPKLDGLDEILADGADSFLVPPGACGQFADRVADLLASPELRVRFTTAARAKVAASFSAKTMAAQVETIYLRHLTTKP